MPSLARICRHSVPTRLPVSIPEIFPRAFGNTGERGRVILLDRLCFLGYNPARTAYAALATAASIDAFAGARSL